jgi:hypothetical protein
MTRHEELFDEISGEHMAELLERTARRGIVLRRRAVVTRAALAALVICAVALPLGFSLSHQQAPVSDNAVAVTSDAAFRDVVWKDVHYPGLNFSKVTYPGNIGCNPGSAYGFTVEVQQVSYLSSTQGTEIALALVRCGAGTPTPSSLYAFTANPGSSQPRFLQTLLAPPEPQAQVVWFATGFSISDNDVVLPVRGVTAPAGICCPNVSEEMGWVLQGEHFAQVSPPEHQG